MSPVAPEGLDAPAIAGWRNVVLELAEAGRRLRILHVTLDATDAVISGSDHVHLRAPDGRLAQESVGGRFEADGSFTGTHWHAEALEPPDDADPEWRMTPRPATPAEGAALRALADALVRRALG